MMLENPDVCMLFGKRKGHTCLGTAGNIARVLIGRGTNIGDY